MTMSDEMIYGRRVYFLCPHDAVRNDLVFDIIRNEFEVYVLDDPDVAKEIVAGTSSILFVNIDATEPKVDWQEYLIDLKARESFSRVGVGVITGRTDRDVRRLYIMEIGVDCGVVTLKPQLHNVAHVIMEILRSNDAIGRRNAVRVNCADDPEIRCRLVTSEDTLEARVLNLSSQGLACGEFSPRPPKPQEYFKAIELSLHGKEVRLSGRHFDMRPEDGDPLHVILYDRAVEPDEREKVHRFVQQSLQSNVNDTLIGLQRQLEKRRRSRFIRVSVFALVSLAVLAAVLVFLV